MLTTAAPERPVVLYDGDCVFCTRSVARLRWLAGEAGVEYRSFRAPGALDPFPGVTIERCLRAMQFVRADGRVFGGVEAIVQFLRRRPTGKLALAYYVPGIRQAADLAYRAIAANRFRIAGRHACDGSACGLHDRPGSDK